MTRDPQRLLSPGSDASEVLKGLLQAARDEAPSDGQLERMEAGVRAAVAVVPLALGAKAAVAAKAASAWTAWSTWAVVAVVGGGVSAVTALEVHARKVASVPAPVHRVGAAAPAAALEPVLPLEKIAEPPAAVTPPGHASPARRHSVARRELIDAPVPTAAPAVGGTWDHEPLPAAPLVSAPPEPEHSRPSPSVVLPPDEGAVLGRALDALRAGDAATAWEFVQRDERELPNGPLAQEREAIAIEALAKLGRSGEARARWRGFEAQHPDSPYARRLAALFSK